MAKRFLIATMSMGGGHGMAGQCVADALRELAPDCEPRVIDICDHLAPWFRTLYGSGYLFMVRHIPWLWGFLYRHPARRGGTLPPWLLRRVARPYERLVADTRPDAILTTQITASEATDSLRARGLHAGATATIVTDFDAHPSWRADGIDRFFVPDEAIVEGFLRLGIPARRVEATGIPIRPAFEQSFDVPALKAKHGVRSDARVVLLMGGSLGMGQMEQAASQLLAADGPCDLLIVTGHNQRLRSRLERLKATGESRPKRRSRVERLEAIGENRLRVFGFIDYVHELMAISDLFISKPGGLSMTEAVTLGVPTLAVDPLPGQEMANARHLESRGLIHWLRPGEPLMPAVGALLQDAEARARLSAAGRAYALRGAARRIAARLLALNDPRKSL